MAAQIRIYTINRGQMDDFLSHFNSEVMKLHADIGWNIVSTYINRPQNEFIWVRTYSDAADLEAKGKAFRELATQRGVQLGGNVAKMEIREVEEAFVPATV